MAEDNADFQLFRYDPSLGAAVLFVILFTLASTLHTYQYFLTRTWFFTAFVIGCWCKYPSRNHCTDFSADTNPTVEVVGFIAVSFSRMLRHAHTNSTSEMCRRTAKSQLECVGV